MISWRHSLFCGAGALALLVSASVAIAFGAGTPITTDSRIKTFVYNENDVYRLLTHYGYQLNVEFGNKEEIETISVGDRTGWQIIPSDSRLFIRAMEDKAHTNMTVITNRHAYQFDLYSAPPGNQGWDELVYVVRFYYPDQNPLQSASFGGASPAPQWGGFAGMPPMNYGMPQAAPPMMAPPPSPPLGPVSYSGGGYNSMPMPGGPGYAAPMTSATYNYNYSFTGEQSILPGQMYDDGQRTYLTFSAGQMLPQLFVVTPDRREQPLATSASGKMMSVEGVFPRMVLRFGSSHACIYNEAMVR
jgi:type IV secretory pathway VirB9-like protein